ncbi:breast carcinoma-amplified sequence 3 homolog [Colias croceus]|uniref:breast carcinoma-amplified sequence 3 homolog n=1 Tax=Colias crocea TaxID=72248 RepID=UPI001E27E6BF|nr:breast carcinoma-amplified sequence 3 homolog [Colias croceus]
MSAESPRHVRSGGPLTVPSQPPSDRSIIDAVSGFINDVTLSSSSAVDPKDVIQWARFETADINEPTPEGDSDNDVSPLLLILGYGAGVQVWLISPNGEAQEVLSWRQGTVRVLRILPTPQHGDCFASKRPLIALCDSASPGPAFCSLSFISIRGGEQVKSIKFKNPILDVLANKRSVVVSFSERFAVFDAATLEDRLAITTCYPCPCPLGGTSPINPLALGDRWLAYADKKLNPSKRSSGGCESEGVTSYTATVLHAAKSLSKGLRGLGESVAHSLAGGRSTSQSPSPPHTDIQQPGIVTILDIEGNEDEDSQDCEEPCDPIVAHFIAHSEAIIALKFDPSGMLLITADRRGHDFHVFRINPHPCGPSLASVHHLYVLHRGDTTARVQDIAISGDSRWAAISTLRGTTHVFALSPYGGACGVRTHTQPRVVNRLSRFHRSAGLPIHAAAAHAHTHTPGLEGSVAGAWYPNPRLPPYPLPSTSTPLAQLRPTHNLPTHTITRTSSGRQRLSSLSEESGAAPLLARSWFGCALPSASGRGCAVPLYLMAANGSLLHLLLHPRPARCVAKEKICDESPIEVEVEAVAQWMLQRPAAAADLLAPLPPSNPLLQPLSCRRCADMCVSEEERWLSQVEIVTHAGPHRRLWMGPQFVFKTYNCGSNSSLSEAEAVEVDTGAGGGAARSNPVNMPGVRPVVPVLISSGSASSLEHSPSDSFRRKSLLADGGRASVCDVQLKEDLAEAMKEDHAINRFEAEQEELSSSSFSSASRASLDPPSSPTPSCSGDNLLHFPGDSSSSL